MKTKKISFGFKKKKFNFTSRVCGVFSSGLMLRTRRTLPCLFEFQRPTKFKITSLFVFFPFLAVWLDSKNKVVDFKVVWPFTFEVSPIKPFLKLLEVPITDENMKILELLVAGERFK